MLGGTVLEARSWAMPGIIQDLAALLSSERTLQDTSRREESAPAPTLPDASPLPRQSDSSERRLYGSGKRRTKQKTKFLLAHAAPVSRSGRRLSTRPRTVLQLQRVSDTPRPLPTYDVVSSTALASRLTRTVPKMVNGERWINADSLVLLRSDMYGQDSGADSDVSDDSRSEMIHRRVNLGSICYSRSVKRDSSSDEDQICLENGLIWEAARLKVGVYEFSGKNHHGLKVRWVLRRPSKTSAKRNSALHAVENFQSSRFTFSIINPSTRRHPVIATLTRDNKLDILDRFPTSTSSGKTPESCSNGQSPVTSEFSSDTAYFDRAVDDGSSHLHTDENLRILIILTGIWVMSKEGWSDTLSRSSMVKKQRGESTNGSPSAVVSSIGGVPWASPSDSRRSFHLDRSSASLFSQRTSLKQFALNRRRHSADSSVTRRETVDVSQAAEINTFLLPAALCYGQEQVEHLANRGSECIEDDTHLPEKHPGDDADAPKPSAVPECLLQDGSVREGPYNEEQHTDEGKERQRRWKRFVTNVKTLAGPCIGTA